MMEEIEHYTQTTNEVTITVRPSYSPELSQPEKSKYVFIYKVEIFNNSDSKIKLLSRRWSVIENDGIIHKIDGEGVVGLQPIIDVNEGFEYSSQAILFQPSGIMYGKYFFRNLDTGVEFDSIIPAFNLSFRDEFEDAH